FIHLHRADVDEPQAIGPGLRTGACRLDGRRSEASGRKAVQHLASVRLGCLEIAKDVLDEDYGGIDDNPEIYRADGEQVCVLSEQHQDDDAEEQRERDIDTDNNRASQVTKEGPLD